MSTSPILDVLRTELRQIKQLADKSIAQLDDDQVWFTLDPEANSVAILMRHMAGNMRSRWTDFRTSDGEKPDRHRDREFEAPARDRVALTAEWEDGWACTFAALAPLSDTDLQDTVYIREEPHTILQAISRQVAHYAGHSYQIMLIAKHLKGADWRTLSIPRGQSEQFNARMLAKRRAQQA